MSRVRLWLTIRRNKGKIVADYQKEKEDEWVRGLRAKYPVEVYQNVVDTVNKH